MMFLTKRHSKILELWLCTSSINPKYNDLFPIEENNLFITLPEIENQRLALAWREEISVQKSMLS